jgi:hypothetical protein
MAALAGAGGVRARYVESRHISLLREPLEEEGMLYFDPPDRLARHAERPIPGSVMVRGDLEALRARYDAEWAPTPDSGWRLRLVPRSRLLRRFVEAIVVEGNGARVLGMQRFEAGGDKTLSRFRDVEIGVSFSPEEERTLFGAPGPAPAP